MSRSWPSQRELLPFAVEAAIGLKPSLSALLKTRLSRARRVSTPGAPFVPKRKSERFQSAELIVALPREFTAVELEPAAAVICAFERPSVRLPARLMISAPGAITNRPASL